jgi:hypothetical protein
MAQTTLGFGIGLILLGLASFFGTGRESVTALIPAFFGIVFLILGVIMRDEAKARHAGHAAATVALLGLIGSARGIPSFVTLIGGGEVERPAAAIAQTLMAVVCLTFIGLGVKSFRDARKAREAA